MKGTPLSSAGKGGSPHGDAKAVIPGSENAGLCESYIHDSHSGGAGHDYFSPGLIERYFSAYIQRLGISSSEFLGLGRQNPANASEDFCMTVLALRLASFSNGVSKLHGEVSRRMWSNLWQGFRSRRSPSGM